jgi:UDP-glucuronate decarboxylase
MAMGISSYAGPINLGNPNEVDLLSLAESVISLLGSKSELVFRPLPEDDPKRRNPDITRARALLNWEPTVNLTEGLLKTANWMSPLL